MPERFKKTIKNTGEMLRIVWKEQKIVFFYAGLFCICDIISPLQDTYIPKLIVDGLGMKKEFAELIPLLLGYFLIQLYKNIVYPLYNNYLTPLCKTRLMKALNLQLFDKIKRIDLECYDNKEFYDKYTRALNEIDSRAWTTFSLTLSLIRKILYVSVLFAVIAVLDIRLVLLCVACSLISFFFQRAEVSVKYEFNLSKTSKERDCAYAKRVVYLPEYAKEVRVFGMIPFLKEKYTQSMEQLILTYKKTGKKLAALSECMEIIVCILLYGAVSVYITLGVIHGKLTAGDFIALQLAVIQLFYQMDDFGSILNGFYENALYIDFINEIMNRTPVTENAEEGQYDAHIQTINVVRAGFRYPGAEQMAFQDISFTINPGQCIAIVGANGSGKSSLVKNLLRLYDLNEGEIRINDVNIKEWNVDCYRKRIGVLFQDGRLLSYSILDNLTFHQAGLTEEIALKALQEVAMKKKIQKLPEGIHTFITNELSEYGTNFSGGESQSLMLSRMFLKDYDLLILDEPTSALDSIAEYNIYKKLMGLHKTMIIITHNLRVAQSADQIIYMKEGRVESIGTHDELYKNHDGYREMFVYGEQQIRI